MVASLTLDGRTRTRRLRHQLGNQVSQLVEKGKVFGVDLKFEQSRGLQWHSEVVMK